jgi:hypothetical protein
MWRAPSIEVELLLLCARTSIDARNAQRIADLALRVDWDRLIEWARRHGVQALLLRTLSGLGPLGVPGDVLDRLRAKCQAIRFQNLVFARVLHTALQLFQDAGIPATPYKGPALSAFLYGDTGLREFTDIDVLVRPCDALRARQVLLNNGFLSRAALSRRAEPLYVRFHCSFPLVSNTGVLVDLNWRVGPWYWRLPEIAESAWAGLRPLLVEGRSVPWFPSEHILFSLCLHGCMHKWELLKWIVDVAELLRRDASLDWPALTEHSRRTGCDRMLALGLVLAADLLDAPVPESALDAVRSDPLVSRLAQEVHEKLFASRRILTDTAEELRFMGRAARHYDAKAFCHALIPAYFVLHHVLRPGLAGLRRAIAG